MSDPAVVERRWWRRAAFIFAVAIAGCSGGSRPAAWDPSERASTASASGLLAAYGFSEGAGASTADASGNGITGTLSAATWTTGRNAGGLAFNGSSAYVDLGNPATLQITGSMTVSAWTYETANVGDDGQIVAKSDGSAGWQLKSTPDTGARTFGIAVSGTGGVVQRYSRTARALNTWYHVAGVYDASAQTLSVYVNGVLDNGVLSGTVPSAQLNAKVNVNLGRRTGGFYIRGTLDDVRIYGRALTQAEIQSDMNTAVGGGSADTVPPSTPGGLAATAISSSRIDLAWSAAADNVAVTGYRVFRNGAAIAFPSATSHSDVGVAGSTTYSYAVSALDASGNESSQSTAVSATTPPATGPDTTPPSGNVLINGGATATNSRAATLTLSASDAVSAVTQMRFSNAPTGFSAAEAYATTKAWTLTTGAGTKTVYVQFKDAAGNWSGSFTDTIVVDTTVPVISAVSATNIAGNGATILWTTNEPATSQVQYGLTTSYGSLTTIDPNLVLAHQTALAGLAARTTYNYRVRSKDAAGNERLGSNGTFTTLASIDTSAPTVPAGVTARALSISQISVSWTASTDNVGVAGYRIFRGGTQVASATTTSFTDSGLAPNTTCIYTVSAFDGANNASAQSAAASGTTLPDTTPPSVPTNLLAPALSSSRINLSWTAASDNVAVSGYTIFRDGVPIASTSGAGYSDPDLSHATTYAYAVAAFDAAGNVSAPSGQVSGTTLPVISVSPSTSVVSVGGTETLTCTVSLEGADTSCTWSIEEDPAGGSIASTGPNTALYSAPATTGAFHLIATSTADSSRGTAEVAVVNSATPTLVQHIASSTNPIGISGNAGNDFRFNLPNPVGAGDCLILGISYQYSSTRTVRVSDNNGNTWPITPAATVTDGGNLISSIFVLPGAHGGPTQVTVTFDANLYNFQYALSEFYNVAAVSPLNGSSTSRSTSTRSGIATISSGSFTPAENSDAAGGNLIWSYFASNSDGSSHTVTNWTAGAGFKPLHSDIGWHDQGMPTASEYSVQPTQASINPGISVTATGTDSYNAVSVALKAAFAGTAPSPDGIRIVRQNISSLNNFTGVKVWTVQFPSVGNLLVLTTPQASVMPTTSITDTAGNIWVKYAPDDQDPQIWYVANATPDPNLQITFHMSSAPTGAQSALMYDIVGADTNPIDARAEKLNATVTSTDLIDSPVITPASMDGLTIAAVTLGQGPISQLDTGSPSGAVFDYVYYSNEVDTDLMDNADGRAHLYNSDLTTEHWNWLLVGPTGNNNYASVAVHFKAAPRATLP